MGKSGKKTVLVIMLLLPPLLSACRQTTSQELQDPTLRHGKALFGLWCAQCHAVVRNDERIAPDLSGVGDRLTPDHMARMIKEPAAFYPGTIMPPEGRFSAAERRALVAYLCALRHAGENETGFRGALARCKELMKTLRGMVSRSS